VVGAAAGFGVFLIAMGAAVLWIRLDSVGLPAERGVGVASKQTLAVIGARVLLEPMAVGVVLLGAMLYIAWQILGPPPILVRAPGAGVVLPSGVPPKQRPRRRRLHSVLVVEVVLVALILPLSWTGLATFLGFAGSIFFVLEGRRLAGHHQTRARQIFVTSTLLAIIAFATPWSLATQAQSPPRLQRAVLTLTGGLTRSGYFVGENDGAVYIGAHGSITSYPHERIRQFAVFDAAPAATANSLAKEAFDAL
jgi:hypothetical protein